MKAVFFFLALFLYLNAEVPNWYLLQNIQSKSYEIIGYGEGKTLAEAKQIAKSDIAKSIVTTIKSNTTIKKKAEGDNYKREIIQNINESTTVELSRLQTVKSEFLDGKYFVALRYINLPLAKRIGVDLKSKTVEEEKSLYLRKTELLNELKNEIGYYPKVELFEKEKRVYLEAGDKNYLLTSKDLKKLFAEVANSNIKTDLKSSYKNGEHYFVTAKTEREGYLNYFQISENGESSLIYENIKDKNYTFPDKVHYNGLEAYIPENKEKTKDLHLFLLCNERIDFSSFEKVSSSYEKNSYKFDKILKLLKKCDFTTKVSVIR